MAALLPSLAVALLLLLFSAAADGHGIIHQACLASLNPASCQSSLLQSHLLPHDASILQVIQTALLVSSNNLRAGKAMVLDIEIRSIGNRNRSAAATTCRELLRYANYRINLAERALPRGQIKDARAWMSAALTYQYACLSRLKSVTPTAEIDRTMAYFNGTLIASTSDALRMLANYDVHGDKIECWGPIKTERDGFWEPLKQEQGTSPVFKRQPLSDMKPNVTVCKGGGCDYECVQQAVEAAPDTMSSSTEHFVIRIKAGIYKETVRVALKRRNVVFLGDGMGKTVITGSMSVNQGMSTYNTATVGILGDGFKASGLTIMNTAGPAANQAVAFRSDSDHSIVENCEFIGNQDTLYAHNLRQYYKSCRIQGNIDFVFGNSAAFFEDCLILVSPRHVNPENNVVAAHGRVDPAQSTGFVFQNCVINGTDEYMALYYSNPDAHKNSLGRPWKAYSRMVFINCTMEALITPQGWMPWSGEFGLKTLYFGEFGNIGPGSDTRCRVNWSSKIPGDRVCSYSLQNFIGDRWIPKSSFWPV